MLKVLGLVMLLRKPLKKGMVIMVTPCQHCYTILRPLSEKNGIALDKTKIVEFFQLWDEFPGRGFNPMQMWFHRHNLYFFLSPIEYEDYLMCLLSGELTSYKMINVYNIISTMKSKYSVNSTKRIT